MSSFSISSLLRNEHILNAFGPPKPKTTLENFEYRKQVEVFVYNTTAKIANGAVITAVTAATAAIFSMIGLLFAAVLIVGSVGIHRMAAQSLPQIKQSDSNKDDGVYVLSKLTAKRVESHFGIDSDAFFEAGKFWQPFAVSLAGHGIWANSLPTMTPTAPVSGAQRERSTTSI